MYNERFKKDNTAYQTRFENKLWCKTHVSNENYHFFFFLIFIIFLN